MPAVAECPAPGVAIAATTSDAAMGLRVQMIEMVNCGDQPFTVNGYPSLRVLDEDRKPLPVEFLKGSSQISTVERFERQPREVTLQPGERATSGIVWKNRHTDLNAPMLGKFLEYSPGEGRPWQPEPKPDHVDLGSTNKIGVAPWEKKPSS